jgi:UDP-N-acetylglucosamine 2-epimerase
MKIMTVVGTRPEIIRLSEVVKRLDSTFGVTQVLVHSGQNWDPKLRDVFFEDLQLRAPDETLNAENKSLGNFFGLLFPFIESVIEKHKPDAFLVLGDTNSALSTIVAKRLQIATYHMEAGNRCFDANVPEELNRRIVDHVSDFNLAYTEHARKNLLSEGIHPRTITVTGSPLNEVLTNNLQRIKDSKILSELYIEKESFFLVSVHRAENVDFDYRLEAFIKAMRRLWDSFQLPILVSTHPRLRKFLKIKIQDLEGVDIRFLEPFGFLDYCKLQLSAKCVLSDSGTIAEESSILGFSAVTLRNSIERPEALDTGSIEMADLDSEHIVDAIHRVISRSRDAEIPEEYLITNTSGRAVNFILSTAPRHQQWFGIRKNN